MYLQKALQIFQILILLTYLIFYFFPEWFDFNSQGWAQYLMAFLFGTLIITGLYKHQNKKKEEK